MKAEDKYEAAMVDVTEAYLDESDAPEDSKDEARAAKPPKAPSARITPIQAATVMLGLGSSVEALPRVTDAPRYAREYRLADVTVWKQYDVVILGEHAGVVRETFGQTLRAASVCNRPTMIEPSENCEHLIGDYNRFMAVYPYVPRLVLGHPTCDPMNKASHRARVDKIASGTAWNLVRESVDMAHFGLNSAVEQPATDLAYSIGRPQIITSFAKQGSTLNKTWWLFTRPDNPLPPLPDAQPVVAEPYVSTISNADRDQAMVAKSITAPAMARTLYEHWHPDLLSGRAATRAEHQHAMKAAWYNFVMYAATYAPMVFTAELEAVAHTLVIPYNFTEVAAALMPLNGALFAVPSTADIDADAVAVSRTLNGCHEPLYAGTVPGDVPHRVYLLPHSDKPAVVHDCIPAHHTFAWLTSRAIATMDTFAYSVASMAVARARAEREPMPCSGLSVGVWQQAKPLVQFRSSQQYQQAPASSTAASQWRSFLNAERERKEVIKAAFAARDNGDGRMLTWSSTCRTAADIQSELPMPLAGLPDIPMDVARMAALPSPPPPLVTEWLVRMPPQAAPQGCPRTMAYVELIKRAYREHMAAVHTNAACHDLAWWVNDDATTPREPFHVWDACVFHWLPHIDGVGGYRLSDLQWEKVPEDDTKVQLLDYEKHWAEHRDIEFFKSVWGDPREGTAKMSDHELLSFIFQGTCYKTRRLDEIRMGHTLDSMFGRYEQVTKTYHTLHEAGLYGINKLMHVATVNNDGTLTFTGNTMPSDRSPFWLLPGQSTGGGGTDKKDNPSEKRPVNNYTEPHKLVKARVNPHGPPSGDVAVSLNEMTGAKPTRKEKLERQDRTNQRLRDYNSTGVVPRVPRSIRVNEARSDSCGEIVIKAMISSGSPLACPYDSQPPSLVLKTMQLALTMGSVVKASKRTGLAIAHQHLASEAADAARMAELQRLVREHDTNGRRILFKCDSCDPSALCHCHAFMAFITLNSSRSTDEDRWSLLNFPDNENKPTPADVYTGTAAITAMARVNNTFAVGTTDDVRWCFFQFWLRADQYQISMVHLLMRFGDRIFWVNVLRYVMDMGVRPATKIACRFTEAYLGLWRSVVDEYVAREWLPQQTQELQSLLTDRRRELGADQARPYFGLCYTDDYYKTYCDVNLAAWAEEQWLYLHDASGTWMSKPHKKALGTVPDWIGGRYVLNGGFGCFPPSKRIRLLDACREIVHDTVTRSRYQSECSFTLSHAAPILALEREALKQLSSPLNAHGFDADPIAVAPNIKGKWSEIARQVQNRPVASFMSAVDDSAPVFLASVHTYSSSDACTDVPHPAIYLNCHGSEREFMLDHTWLSKHITVLESTGDAMQVTEYGALLDTEEHVVEGDSAPASSMLVGDAQSENLSYIDERLNVTPTAKRRKRHTWTNHRAGRGNWYTDMGSRRYLQSLDVVSAAYGIERRVRRLTDETILMLEDIQLHTSNVVCEHPAPPVFTCAVCAMAVTAIEYHLRVCVSCGFRGNLGGRSVATAALLLARGVNARATEPLEAVTCLYHWLILVVVVAAGLGFAYARSHVPVPIYQPSPPASPPEQGNEPFVEPKCRILFNDRSRVSCDMCGKPPPEQGRWLKCNPCVTGGYVSHVYCSVTCQRAHWPVHRKTHSEREPFLHRPNLNIGELKVDATPVQIAALQGHKEQMNALVRCEQLRESGKYGRLMRLAEEFMVSHPNAAWPYAYAGMALLSGATSDVNHPRRIQAGLYHIEYACRCRRKSIKDWHQWFARGIQLYFPAVELRNAHLLPMECRSDTTLMLIQQEIHDNVDTVSACDFKARLLCGHLSALVPECKRSYNHFLGAIDARERAIKLLSKGIGTIDNVSDVIMQELNHIDWLRSRAKRMLALALVQGMPACTTLFSCVCLGADVQYFLGAVLSPGDHVTITGLTTRDDLNGLEGVLSKLSLDAKRWRVRLSDGTYLAVRPTNLVAAPAVAAPSGTPSPPPSPTSPDDAWQVPPPPPLDLTGTSPRTSARAELPSTFDSPPCPRALKAAPPSLSDSSPFSTAPSAPPDIIHSAPPSEPISPDRAPPAVHMRPARQQRSLPANPNAARAQAAALIADTLISDTSPYALLPDNPEAVRRLCTSAMRTQERGTPHGTARSNDNGYKWALGHCLRTNQSIMRPLVLDAVDRIREPWFYAHLFLDITERIPARARRDPDAPTQGKPSSGLLAVLAFRRVLRSCTCELVSLTLVYAILKGKNAEFRERWGKHALVVKHMRCFQLSQLLAIAAALRACQIVQWTAIRHEATLLTVLYMLHTAARNDEAVESYRGDSYPTHTDFEWYDAGIHVPATPANVGALTTGALLCVLAQPSKADQDNATWGNKKMHFELRIGEPLNFAAAWRQWQLNHPVALDRRASTPAFSPTADAVPYRGDELQTDFNTLLVFLFGIAIAALHSLHAIRVTVACVLLAHKRSDGRIQAMCRWKSPESLRVYAEMTAAEYASEANLVTVTDGSAYGSAPRPVICEADALQDLNNGERELARAMRMETRKPRASSSTHVDVGEGEIDAYASDSWGIIGQTITVPGSVWELPEGSYECTVAALIPTIDQKGYEYAVYIDGSVDLHYRMEPKLIKEYVSDVLKQQIGKKRKPQPTAQ